MELQRVAVLVDADNVSGDQIRFAVGQAAKSGRLVLKRAFGRLSAITGKAEALAANGFVAEVALPPPGSGKNAADVMLAQYATRLAERRVVEIVALVSSDGDFAPVAMGLAEAGIRTLGFGRQDAPAALQDACAAFVVFPAPPAGTAPATAPAPLQGVVAQRTSVPQGDRGRLTSIVEKAMTGGRVHLSDLGKQLNAAFGGDYKARFGGMRLSELVAGLEGFAMEGNGANKEWVIRRPPARVVSLAARPVASE